MLKWVKDYHGDLINLNLIERIKIEEDRSGVEINLESNSEIYPLNYNFKTKRNAIEFLRENGVDWEEYV